MRRLLPLLLCVGCEAPAPQLVSAGFGLSWERLSHRVALARAGVADVEGEAATLLAGFVGGDWSTGGLFADRPLWEVAATEVRSDDLRMVTGVVTLAPVAGAEATVTVTPELPRGDVFAPIVQGWSLRTDVAQSDDYPNDYDPALGWLPVDLEVAVGPLSDGAFEARARFVAGALPEGGLIDRSDLDEASPFARVEIELHWAVLAAQRGAWTPATIQVQALYGDDDPPTEHPPVPVADRTVPAEGAGVRVPAVTGFRFLANPGQERPGRFWRSARASVRGAGDALIGDLYLSHSSAIEEGPLSWTGTLSTGWMALRRGEATPRRWGATEDEVGIFDATVELGGGGDLVIPAADPGE